jgi:polyphosphate kinase
MSKETKNEQMNAVLSANTALPKKLKKKYYEKELAHMQEELVKMLEWIKAEKLKVIVVFEGRDAAGKGGVIKRISSELNPRYCRVVALGVPTEREKSQWYFQRYVNHLPAEGEMVIFDRSWYNRAGVERVMGFCTDDEYWEFLRSCPNFERMLIRSGITLIKYWFSVSREEQYDRFQARIRDPKRYWKISQMDIASLQKFEDYSRAKDEMIAYTDTKESPWWVVESDDKKKARLNCMHHLLSMIPYKEIPRDITELPPMTEHVKGYVRAPKDLQTYIPEVY